MPETLTPEQQLVRLHALVKETEPALWQTQEFQDKSGGDLDVFSNLNRHSAGSLSIGGQEVKLTFLSEQEVAGDWKKYIPKEIATEIIHTLEKISTRWGNLGVLDEVSVCLKQPINPENQEPANGYTPVAFIVDQASQHVTEIPAGTVMLFPHALTPEVGLGPYRGTIKDLPHIAGVVAHEWSHQFMSSENTELFQEWVKAVPGWEKAGDAWVVKSNKLLPTPYSSKNPTDDFIESMTLYLLKPELLQSEHPERYAFCEEFARRNKGREEDKTQ